METLQDIRLQVRKGRTEQALDQLLDLANCRFPQAVQSTEMLIGRAEKNRQQLLNNLISHDTASVETSKINFALLKMIEQLEQGKNVYMPNRLVVPLHRKLLALACAVLLFTTGAFVLHAPESSTKWEEVADIKDLKKTQLDDLAREIDEEAQRLYQELEAVAEAAVPPPSTHRAANSLSSPSVAATPTELSILEVLKETSQRVSAAKSDYDELHLQLLPAIEQKRVVRWDGIERRMRLLPEKYALDDSADHLLLLNERASQFVIRVQSFSRLMANCSSAFYFDTEDRLQTLRGYQHLDSVWRRREAVVARAPY